MDSSDERETENLDGGLFGMATKNFNHYLTECDSSKQYDGKDVGKCEVVRLWTQHPKVQILTNSATKIINGVGCEMWGSLLVHLTPGGDSAECGAAAGALPNLQHAL